MVSRWADRARLPLPAFSMPETPPRGEGWPPKEREDSMTGRHRVDAKTSSEELLPVERALLALSEEQRTPADHRKRRDTASGELPAPQGD